MSTRKLKPVGLIGGISWQSTKIYYEYINHFVQEELGELYSAPLLINSFNFKEVAELQRENGWEELGEKFNDAAHDLRRSGAKAIAICANTMHIIQEQTMEDVNAEFISVITSLVTALQRQNLKQPLLLGTRYTMESDGFYRDSLLDLGVESVLVPEEDDQKTIHDAIYEELCVGRVEDRTRRKILAIIEKYVEADSVILGCTELPMIVSTSDVDLPLLDTALLHSKAIARFVCS